MKLLRVVILFGIFAASAAQAADEAQAAVWKTQEVTFRYSGFTSKYSCMGLRDKLRGVLMVLGARESDLKLSYRICGADIDAPAPFPSIAIKMATLHIAQDDAAGTLPAHWRIVDAGRIANYERGDCELAEQVRQTLLPLFTTRNVKSRDDGCTTRSTPTGSPELELETLIADPPTK